MKKFTLLMAVALLVSISARAQEPIGLYTFSNADDIWANSATAAGVGTIMCEGVFKFDPDAEDTSADDMASVELTDYEVIDGISNKAIALKAHNWFKIWHGIAANGGGEYVNDFSVVIDVRVADAAGIYSLVEVNPTPTANGYTSELEIADLKVGSVGAPSSDYDELGFSDKVLAVDTWYRIVYAAKLGTSIDVYVNGEHYIGMTGDFTDARPAPYSADNHADDAAMKIGGNNEAAPANDPPRDGDKDIDLIAIYNVGLSADEVAALGAPGTWVGVKDQQVAIADFSIYPNPAKDMLYVSGAELAKIEIISVSGQLIKSIVLDGQNSIDISSLNAGMYLVKGTDNSKAVSIEKLIVE
jgi:hypothetical protein